MAAASEAVSVAPPAVSSHRATSAAASPAVIDIYSRSASAMPSAQAALLAAVAEASDEAAAPAAMPALPMLPPLLPAPEPAAPSLMLALLSEAAVAAAAPPPDSPARAEREAAAADEHTRSCALLRALSHGVAAASADEPMQIDQAVPAVTPDLDAEALILADAPASDDDVPALMEPPATRPDEDVASDDALRHFCAELRDAHATVQPDAACVDDDASPLPPPPPLGTSGACAEPRLLHAALMHSLVLAPALAPPATHVPSLSPPFLPPDASAPTAATLAFAAARAAGAAAAPGAAARAALELPWGADAAAMAPARRARLQAARLPQRLEAPGDAEPQRSAARESIAQLLDVQLPDALPSRAEPEREQRVALPQAVQAPLRPVPPPPQREPLQHIGNDLGYAYSCDAADEARHAQNAADAAVTEPPCPPPRLHCWDLPAAPHGKAWRALRSVAAGVAARDVARHDPRDAAALTDMTPGVAGTEGDAFWAGGPDLASLQRRIRAVAPGAPAHVQALAACYALHAAAQTLAHCGVRAALAYLEAAMRAVPAISQQPTAGAMAAARAALTAAFDATQSAADDHPPIAVTLRAAMLSAGGGKVALVADARCAAGVAAVLTAGGTRLLVLEHEGPFELAACAGDAAGVAAALRAAAAGCDALLLTHAQAAAAATHAPGGLCELFAAAALLSPPPPGPAVASLDALLTVPLRSFTGAVHVCVVRPPPAEVAAAVPTVPKQPPRPAPRPRPAAAPPPPPPEAVAAPTLRADDDDDEDSGFATGLVALSSCSVVLRSWPALRDAILRLEGRRSASVATRELGIAPDASADACAAVLLLSPDALAVGPARAVVALRVLRGDADAALLAAAAGIEPRSLAADCALVAIYADALAIIFIAPSAAAARAASLHAAALAAAAAAAALPLRFIVAADDASGRDAALAALDWALAAPPEAQQGAASAPLRALPDTAPPGEALLRCCGGLNALSAHALLASGLPLAALLRADLTDAQAIADAAGRGGVALSADVLRAFDAFRTALLGAQPQQQMQKQEAPPEAAPWHHASPPQQQHWEDAQAAAAREAWRAAPSPPGGWREAQAAAAQQQLQVLQQQRHVAPSPSPSLELDDVALLLDEPLPSAAWALPATSAAHAPQPASSAAMGRAGMAMHAPSAYQQPAAPAYDGGAAASVRGLLDDFLQKVSCPMRFQVSSAHVAHSRPSMQRRGGAGYAAPQQQQQRPAVGITGGVFPASAACSSSSDGSDDMRGFLRGLDGAPPPAAMPAPPAVPMRPHWRAVAAPAASGSAPPAPQPYRREAAPPMLDAFRCAAARGATPPPMAHGGPGGFVFQPRGGAAKRLRFTDDDVAHSPAGSAAAGASMRSLGGVRFAPGVLPQGAGGRAVAVPSAPLPPPPVPASALRATPEAKQKLHELLKKMDPRRGGGNKPRAARHL